MMSSSGTASKLDQLEARVGANWTAIRAARVATRAKRQKLSECFITHDSPDTSLVVFGSVAREEVTSGSDLDWILLIDGQSVPEHKEQERTIARMLVDGAFIPPGRSGIFGGMVGSHDLVHHIGGEDDLNSNTTRRVLLLLESYPVGNREAYDRVRRQIIRRYLGDDRGLTHAGGDVRIPRFLLNDLTRYWRTIAVDFVYKQRADDDKKWAIRNAKLRLSRKLIFAAGLAIVFFCHLDAAAAEARTELLKDRTVSRLTAYLVEQFALTPLEIIAKACVDLGVPDATARDIFDNYDRFLSILDDREQREELERAQTHDDLRSSSTWETIRQVSKPFHDGLVALFLRDNEQLKGLTMKYGVF
ncbi:MAG TPA: nucleotidyltransferase domain-containing protein [Acidobacteriaceae bacterium]|nr:nucleotidyltransferase domain-containing protein [Acidobacteriaceae bacterium]